MSFLGGFFSSNKPNARTRVAPIDVVAPQPIPSWPQYYRQHLLPTPPQPDHNTEAILQAHTTITALPQPSPAANARVKLWQGDITRLKVGAVVNAANSGMWAGGGICGAIHSAAGSELEAECERWVAANGDVPTGSTLVTRAYRLPAEFVFHTVGPKNGSWENLRSCYRSCLEMMIKHQCRSIAFCCISTGIYGFPNLEAALCALLTVREWLDEDERHQQAVDCIVFCNFLDKDRHIYERHMPLFFPLTPAEAEGTKVDEVAAAVHGGGGGGDVDGKEGDEVKEGGGESKRHRADRSDSQPEASGEMMEVSRGDTVWVRTDNTTDATPAVQEPIANGSTEAAVGASSSPPPPPAAAATIEETDQTPSAQDEEEQRKHLTASILARNIQFSRAPPPSTTDTSPHPAHPHHAHPHNRRPCVLFFSSTSSLTPHVAALLTNTQHGTHVQAIWSTSHSDGPLVDEVGSEVMEEMHLDESDDAMTKLDVVKRQRVDCVVAVDEVARQQAEELFGSAGGQQVVIVCHAISDPQAGGGGSVGGEQKDLAHLQVRYRQAFNEVKALVDDLPAMLERLL